MTEIVKSYHVFADGLDDWFSTLKEAKQCYRNLVADGYQNVRLYRDVSEINGDLVDETYVQGRGEFPS